MTPLWLGEANGARLSFDRDSLVTHGVCIGMTGSGKTGLCIALLEEVARTGVPIIAIDPKGDLTNLALTEPSPERATEWLAGQKKAGVNDVAEWARTVQVQVYTPGSDAARAVDVLAALRRPGDDLVDDAEARRELVAGCVSSIFALAGIDADPVRSPAHVVLARILDDAWQKGEDPDLVALLSALINPPFKTVGVFPTDTFFPPDDRMALALQLNTLLASPSFAAWQEGEPLDVGALLEPGPRISVFTLAHLSEPERHFFVGLLLDRLAAWTRTLPGSSALRALIFFDEVWGYLPPHPKNPPAKRPLLTLLKQARAVGVGVVLATQNPVDLDYKALSNAGTWFVGRLQTKNDRERVRDGLTSAGGLDDVDALLDAIAPRRFLLHRAGKSPTLFDTRWTRCFLAGPLTRVQLRALRGAVNAAGNTPARPTAPVVPASPAAPTVIRAMHAPKSRIKQWLLDPRIVFSAALDGAFTPFREVGGRLRPALLVQLRLRFDEERWGFVDQRSETRVWFPLDDGLPLAPIVVPIDDAHLLIPGQGSYDPLPGWLDEPAELASTVAAVVEGVVATESAGLFVCAPLKLNSKGDETQAEFRVRCEAAAEERIRQVLALAGTKVNREVERLEEKARKLAASKTRYATTASARQTEEIVNAGEMLLSFFTGRKKSMTTLASHRGRTATANAKVEEIDDELSAIREAIYDLEQRVEAEASEVKRDMAVAMREITAVEVRLEPEDVKVLKAGVLWVPVGGG